MLNRSLSLIPLARRRARNSRRAFPCPATGLELVLWTAAPLLENAAASGKTVITSFGTTLNRLRAVISITWLSSRTTISLRLSSPALDVVVHIRAGCRQQVTRDGERPSAPGP